MKPSRIRVHGARSRVVALVVTALVVLSGVAMLSMRGTPVAAATADYTFEVNDLRRMADADLNDGQCRTSAGLCTLDAAIQQANALNAVNPDTTVLITPAASIRQYDGSQSATGLINVYQARATTANNATYGGGAPITDALGPLTSPTFAAAIGASGTSGVVDTSPTGGLTDYNFNDNRAMYDVQGQVTIDFQNRLGLTTLIQPAANCVPPNNGCIVKATWSNSPVLFALRGKNQTLRNFGSDRSAAANIAMAGPNAMIYVGATAVNATIENGLIWTPSPDALTASSGEGSGTRRGIVIVGGAKNTTVRGVTFDGLVQTGAGISFLSGSAGGAVDGVRIERSTFANENFRSANRDNRSVANGGFGTANYYAGITSDASRAASAATTGEVRNLIITENVFENWGPSTLNTGVLLVTGTYTGLRIEANTFRQISTQNVNLQGMRMSFAAGTDNVIDNNVFYTDRVKPPSVPSTQNTWVCGAFGPGSTPGLTIRDNNFIGGWNTAQIMTQASVQTCGVGPSLPGAGQVIVPELRNTMTGVSGTPDAQSENVRGSFMNNVMNQANNAMQTAWPELAAVSGVCEIGIRINKPVPPETGSYGDAPTYPYYVDAFAGRTVANGGDGMGLEYYLGRVTISSAADEGRTHAFDNYAGAGAGYVVRLQTQDGATGATSQYSRIATATGTDSCAPRLWIKQAPSQEDPTSNRLIAFDIRSSKPVTGLTAGDFEFTGSAPNTEVSSITATTLTPPGIIPAPTTWRLIAKANGQGYVIPEIVAGAVTDGAMTNDARSNVYPVPLTFEVGPGGSQLAGPDLDNSVLYLAPLTITPLALTVEEGAAPSANPTYQIAHTALAPPTTSPLSIGISWSTLTADPVIGAHPGNTADNVATTSPASPTMTPAQTSIDIQVAAVDNTFIDGTRTVRLHNAVSSADLNYDGLILDVITVTILDNDGPDPSKSTCEVSTGARFADGVDAHTVTATMRNAASAVVIGAVVSFSVSSTDATLSAPTATTGTDGKAEVSITSLTPGTYTAAASYGGVAITCSPDQAVFVNGIELTKSVAANGFVDASGNGRLGDAGDTIRYEFEVRNTSSQSLLTGIAIDDPLLAGATPPITITCASTSLAGGETTVCTTSAAHVITQAEVDAGEVVNRATVTATTPGSKTISADAELRIATNSTAAITLSKDIDVALLKEGDTVTYTMTATNTGAVTLDDVQIKEGATGGDFTGAGTLSPLTCVPAPAAPATLSLAPGQTVTCTATYVVVAGDIAVGWVTNWATATGTGASPLREAVQAQATVTTASNPPASLPLLGGSGFERFGIVGGLLVLIAALALIASARRREGVHVRR